MTGTLMCSLFKKHFKKNSTLGIHTLKYGKHSDVERVQRMNRGAKWKVWIHLKQLKSLISF